MASILTRVSARGIHQTPLTRKVWTNARIQECLNRHTRVADAVLAQDSDSNGGAQSTFSVLPIFVPFKDLAKNQDFSFLPRELDPDELHAWLLKHGFEDKKQPFPDFHFVESESQLPDDGGHSRLVMRKLLKKLFGQLDTDGDGQVTLTELSTFLKANKIDSTDYKNVMAAFHTADYDGSYKLSYDQFKRLVRETNLLRSYGTKEGTFAQFSVNQGLVEMIASEIFKKADLDNEQAISKVELVQVWKAYHLGDEKEALEVFDEYDLNADGRINKDEFTELLLRKGVIDIAENATEMEEGGNSCSIL